MPMRRIASLAIALALSGCPSSAPTGPSPLNEGEKCRNDSDCASGLCAALPGQGYQCRRPCTSGCKASEICTSFGTAASGDSRAGCVPELAGLCKPCQTNSDCPYPADACISIGDATMCGRDCSYDRTCPDGYACTETTAADGSRASRQCVPISGSCDCMPSTVGQTRACVNSNSYGSCSGHETCNSDLHWTACDARIPAPEACNSIDDDCDGAIDEDIPAQTCGLGECANTAPGCANGEVPACTPKTGRTETCNGKDDDCDGVVDNGFNTLTDPDNCGTCGHVCATKTNAIRGCQNGQCTWTCQGSYIDCGSGCTIDSSQDPNHCGNCTTKCGSGPNSTAACNNSSCSLSCSFGWADCDSSAASGCERRLDTLGSPPNCTSYADLGTIYGDYVGTPVIRSGYGDAVFKVHVARSGACTRFIGLSIALQSPPGVDYNLYTSGVSYPCGTGFPTNYAGPGGLETTDTCSCGYCASSPQPVQDYDVYIEITWANGSACGNWTLTLNGKTDSSYCLANCP